MWCSVTRPRVDELDPVVEWKAVGNNRDVVEIYLPGFKKDQVTVQVDDYGVLRAAGERPARGGRWVRFTKDIKLPENCDADGVLSDFVEKLVITLPIVPEEEAPMLLWPPVAQPPFPSPPRPPPPKKQLQDIKAPEEEGKVSKPPPQEEVEQEKERREDTSVEVRRLVDNEIMEGGTPN